MQLLVHSVTPPTVPAQGVFFTLLQKSVQDRAIAGEPATLVAPPALVPPATPELPPTLGAPPTDAPPAGTMTGPPAPTLLDVAPAVCPGDEPETVPPVPALPLGSELPSDGSLSSISVDVRPPQAAKVANEASHTQREIDPVITRI